MSEAKKSQRGFVAVTIITLLAIALVIVAYATLLATFTGGEVTVGGITADVWYSTTNTTSNTAWEASFYNLSTGTDLFSKINTTSAGYAGPVSITWKLQQEDGSWANVSTFTTSCVLDGSLGQNIYASPGGLTTNGIHDWMDDIGATNGKYRVKVWIESTG